MSSWNYRLTVQSVDDAELWQLREIYYDNDGAVSMWSKEPAAGSGESWKECADDIARMASVIGYPAYDLDAKCWVDRKRVSLGRDPRG